MRKLSLDELPNLINNIKRDMVFVAPRPALYNQDDIMDLRVEAGVEFKAWDYGPEFTSKDLELWC